jgi:hypothetical protein
MWSVNAYWTFYDVDEQPDIIAVFDEYYKAVEFIESCQTKKNRGKKNHFNEYYGFYDDPKCFLSKYAKAVISDYYDPPLNPPEFKPTRKYKHC